MLTENTVCPHCGKDSIEESMTLTGEGDTDNTYHLTCLNCDWGKVVNLDEEESWQI